MDNTGWTIQQIIEAVCDAYKSIYEVEGDDPGHIPGLMNRAQSNGRFGIWGHGIDDLILESMEKRNDGIWNLFVGS